MPEHFVKEKLMRLCANEDACGMPRASYRASDIVVSACFVGFAAPYTKNKPKFYTKPESIGKTSHLLT